MRGSYWDTQRSISKIKKEHLSYKQLKQKTDNQKLPMEPAYGVGGRETSYSNVTSLCTEVPLPSEKKVRESSVHRLNVTRKA